MIRLSLSGWRGAGGLRMAPGAMWMMSALPAGGAAQTLSSGGERNGDVARAVVGRVTGPLGEPLAAAQVSIEGTSEGGMTGANGRYRIEGVAAGPYVVVAQRLGYDVGRQPVTVGSAGAAELEFSLAEEALALA